MFVSVLSPSPRNSGVVVVDTRSWKIIKKFDDVGPDCQTMSVSYDGKYVFQIFQRISVSVRPVPSTQDTLEPGRFFPNFGIHHDCVIVPTKREHLLNSRCTTLWGREQPDVSASGLRSRTRAGGGCARFC